MIASHGDIEVSDRGQWQDVWQAANARHPLGQSLSARLRAMHRHRNQILHHGGTADERQATASTRAARELLNELPAVLRDAYPLPKGTGPATALAFLLDSHAPEIAHALRDLDSKMREGLWRDACMAASYALDMARARCDPPLIWSRAYEPDGADGWQKLREREEREQQQLRQVASALGMTPTEYGRLRSVIGRTSGLTHEYPPHFYNVPDVPDPDSVRNAAERVAEAIFRLWETDVMQPGTTEVYRMMAARGIIPDAFG
jgi:hypothetical protein